MISMILATVVALALLQPDNFDSDANLIYQENDSGRLHITRDSASFAHRLLASGTEADIALAAKVIDAVLEAQERHPEDPHYGNFFWYLEDGVVEDLNAVEFVLSTVIPMMIEHGDRLPAASQKKLLLAIRLGLAEIERLDVLPAYTNIAAKDILNSSLGGELLGDARIAERGYRKLVEWMAFTDQFGTTFEFNSPTYSRVTLQALAKLVEHVQHDETKIRAQTMATRIGLSVALHLHPKTGRWAGPHSRAYHPTVVADTKPERDQFEKWVEKGWLPAWLLDALTARPTEFSVNETAFPASNYGLHTYHDASFDLGTSTAQFGQQSNVMIAHVNRPGQKRPGVFYTRYLLNDKWLGDFYHATDRTNSRNLIDEGRFYGIQNRNKAIGAYIPGSGGRTTSAKMALIWTGVEQLDGIWVGDEEVSQFPFNVPAGELVTIANGDVYQAVRAFTVSDLGRDAPQRLTKQGGDLVFELYNYLGKEKVFWEAGWPGAFYQGKSQAGFYTEFGERSSYGKVTEFIAEVRAGEFLDDTDQPFVYAGTGERLWRLGYTRQGASLGMEIDLMTWQLRSRQVDGEDPGWPLLQSSMAQASRSGSVSLGGASFQAGKDGAWLYANPKRNLWVAGYHGLQATAVELRVPNGSVKIEKFGTGTIEWENGDVRVAATHLSAVPVVTGGNLVVIE